MLKHSALMHVSKGFDFLLLFKENIIKHYAHFKRVTVKKSKVERK